MTVSARSPGALAKSDIDTEGLGPFSAWSNPVNLGPVVNSKFDDFHPAISKDGLSLYFTSRRPGGVGPGGPGHDEIWVTQRDDLDEPWGKPKNLGPKINGAGFSTGVPNLTPDGHRLFFGSDRPGGSNPPVGPNRTRLTELWVSFREDTEDDFAWEAPRNLGPAINSPRCEDSPVFFADKRTGTTSLFFTGLDGPGCTFETPDEQWNIYASTLGADGTFGPGVPVTEVNTPFRQTRMAVRSDGLEMLITSNRPGGIGPNILNLNIWVSTRASTRDRWSTPMNVGRPINVGSADSAPALSFDGKTLYFVSRRPGSVGGRDLWEATRELLEDH